MRATGLDHVVLVVADVERSLAWYRDRLGLEGERVDEWRRGEVLFPSLRLDATTVVDLFPGERSGVNVDHLCVVVDEVDLDAVAADPGWRADGPPSEVWGALGIGRSVYVRDPDDNKVELRTYPR